MIIEFAASTCRCNLSDNPDPGQILWLLYLFPTSNYNASKSGTGDRRDSVKQCGCLWKCKNIFSQKYVSDVLFLFVSYMLKTIPFHLKKDEI